MLCRCMDTHKERMTVMKDNSIKDNAPNNAYGIDNSKAESDEVTCTADGSVRAEKSEKRGTSAKGEKLFRDTALRDRRGQDREDEQ